MADIAGKLIGTVLQEPVAPAGQDLQQGIQGALRVGQFVNNLKQNRVKLDQARQELTRKKSETAFKKIEFGLTKVPKNVRSKFFKSTIVPAIEQLDLPINVDTLEMVFADQELSQEAALQLGALAENPTMENYAKTIELLNDPEQALTVLQQGLGRQFQQEKFDKQSGMQEKKFEQQKVKVFTDSVNKLNKQVTGAFKPINDAKQSVRLGNSSFKEIMSDIKKGKTPNENTFNVGVRNIAKAVNSGALTDLDVSDIRDLKGFIGKGDAFMRKWITGGVNPKIVKNLMEVTQQMAAVIDKKAQTVGKQISAQFKSPLFTGREEEVRKLSGLDSALEPTLTPKEKKKVPGIPGYGKMTATEFDGLSDNAKEFLVNKTKLTIDALRKLAEQVGK